MWQLIACASFLVAMTIAPAWAQILPSTAQSRPHSHLADLRPTGQELRSPAWWVDRAIEAAADVPRDFDRVRSYWSCGVTAFDCGRFDQVRQIIKMDLLSEEQRDTLAYRLDSAFERTGDIDRLRETAHLLAPTSFERSNAFQAIAKIHIARREFDAAERVVNSEVRQSSRVGMYLTLIDATAQERDLPLTWNLAVKAATDNNTSSAPYGFLRYIKEAAHRGKADQVTRAIGAINTLIARWPDEMKAQVLRDLSQTLRECGQIDPTSRYVAEARKLTPDPIVPQGTWQQIDDLALDGKFDEAIAVARKTQDVWHRAYGLACISTELARQKAEEKRTSAALHEAAAALADARAAGEPEPSQMLGLREIACQLAWAQAEAGDENDALRTISGIEPAKREDALARLANKRLQENDSRFLKSAFSSDLCRQGSPRLRDELTTCLAIAQAQTEPQAAEELAREIVDVDGRVYAYFALARPYVLRNDESAFDRAIRSARQAALKSGNRREDLEEIARLQSRMLQLRAVWASVISESDPATRVSMMLGAAEGLLGRLGASSYADP